MARILFLTFLIGLGLFAQGAQADESQAMMSRQSASVFLCATIASDRKVGLFTRAFDW